jgi:hypothetical protein
MAPYDHREPTKFTREQVEALVGTRATLPLTGVIDEDRESGAGVFVMFLVDERWGFGSDYRIGIDADALIADVSDGR